MASRPQPQRVRATTVAPWRNPSRSFKIIPRCVRHGARACASAGAIELQQLAVCALPDPSH